MLKTKKLNLFLLIIIILNTNTECKSKKKFFIGVSTITSMAIILFGFWYKHSYKKKNNESINSEIVLINQSIQTSKENNENIELIKINNNTENFEKKNNEINSYCSSDIKETVNTIVKEMKINENKESFATEILKDDINKFLEKGKEFIYDALSHMNEKPEDYNI